MTTPHLKYMRTCLDLASQAPALPTNFRVGALLISRHISDPTPNYTSDQLLSTGYTMQHPGNTHAEQCCLANFASQHNVSPEHVAEVLPSDPDRKLVMYVTMEPCGKRLSGNLPCVERIIRTRGEGAGERKGIEKVYFGVKEPGTFVGESMGVRRLEEAGIEWEVVGGLEREILSVAVAGHEDREGGVEKAMEGVKTDLDGISAEERRRQEGVKRNPKKRMMEGEVMV
ncbi:putative DRAP deaminase [Aspergillus sclerotiicarbonarius CBS 121057]|uniref:Putative DRAP deaminase n=1 Tax=Aspergillus sclerotiicarbonarius (strain CBS 121057 / IBT 28362) TaxID=1448318 RepID=A0A319EBP2_ASPSB|nr:putative DRAP deaminase [Aspergillus sclerotiicarbonarius CBS 121057]